MRKHLLLIQPPFNRLYDESYSLGFSPLSLAYLAGAVLRDTDWSVRMLHADFSVTPPSRTIGTQARSVASFRLAR